MCLIWLQVHRFTIEAAFQVSTTSREGLHPLSFTHLFWIWTIQTRGTSSVHRRWNIPTYKSGDLAGEWIYVSVDLIFFSSSTLVRIQAPSPTLFSQICYLTRWMQKTQAVTRTISPSADRSYSSGLNGSDPEQMSEWQRMKTFLDVVDT